MVIKYLNKNNVKGKIQTFFMYFFVIIMILSNFSLFAYGANPKDGKLLIIIWQALLLGMFVFCLKDKVYTLFKKRVTKEINIPNRILVFIISVLLLFIAFFIVNIINYGFPKKFMVYYFMDPIMIVMILLSLYRNNIDIKCVWYKFENVMLILSAISIVGWILFTFKLVPNSFFTISWDQVRRVPGFFYIDYASQGSSNFLIWNYFVRNTGIFIEAPMYAYVLSMALCVELFLKYGNEFKSVFNWRVVLLIITIFTTCSTNGFIVMLISLFLRCIILISNKKLRYIFLCLVPILAIIIKVIVREKNGNMYSSYGIRMNDMHSSFRAWLNHPLIGNGLNNKKSISQYMYEYRRLNGNDGSSNGLLTILAYGGILYLLYYLIPVILSFKVSMKVAFFALISLVLLFFENVQASSLVIFTFSYLCVEFIVEGRLKNEK